MFFNELKHIVNMISVMTILIQLWKSFRYINWKYNQWKQSDETEYKFSAVKISSRIWRKIEVKNCQLEGVKKQKKVLKSCMDICKSHLKKG